MNGQIDWQAQQISHLVCSLAGQRCSNAWGTFSTWTSQSIKALIAGRSGERKRPIFHPPRSITICVQPGKYWHCFEGNLEETAERWGQSVYGPFWALRCHLELRLKTETETSCSWHFRIPVHTGDRLVIPHFCESSHSTPLLPAAARRLRGTSSCWEWSPPRLGAWPCTTMQWPQWASTIYRWAWWLCCHFAITAW